MKVLEAIVTNLSDETQSGKFSAKIRGQDFSVPVTYTSPYFNIYFQGIFAPPALHTEVLLLHDQDTNSYYYLSTILRQPILAGSISVDSLGKPLPLVMETNSHNNVNQPQKMTFKNGEGAGLSMTAYYSKNVAGTPEPIVSEARLESAGGNKVVVSNSPDAQGVILRNKHGDGVVISSAGFSTYGSRTITIESDNSQACIVKHGEYKINVVNGRDITIRNDSLGDYGMLPIPIPSYAPHPRYLAAPYMPNLLLQFGNLNLVSKYRDINIYTDNPFFTYPNNSNIYVSTDRGMIQLKANGDINIYANTGAVNIQGTSGLSLTTLLGDININSAGNINMRANLGINSNAIGNINNAATNINSFATMNFNAEGIVRTNIGNSQTNYVAINNSVPPDLAPSTKDRTGLISPFGSTYINPVGGTGAAAAISQISNIATSIPKTVLEQGFNVYGK